MLAQGVNPDGVIEFMRGDMVCLRGTVRAFADRRLTTGSTGAPIHKDLTAREIRAAGLPAR